MTVNGIRIIVKKGYAYSKLLEHHANKCIHCEDILHLPFTFDLTPNLSYHKENTELPGHEYTIFWPHTCKKCKSFKAKFKRLIKRAKL